MAHLPMNVFPCQSSGEEIKHPKPGFMWKRGYTNKKALVKRWLADGYWLGLPCGSANNGLEVIDVDQPHLIGPVHAEINRCSEEWGIVIPQVRTIKGLHVYIRSDYTEAGGKVAWSKDNKLLVETRGEGNYVVCPSPGNDQYKFIHEREDDSWPEIPEVTREQREHLIDFVSAYNEVFAEAYVPQEYTGKGRPGDDFNTKGTWEEILKDWTLVKRKGEYCEWRRPGKNLGSISATTGHEGRDIMYLFSSSLAGMESNRAYTKFSAYAFLEYGGDFKSASSSLAKAGYGSQRKKHNPLRALFNLASDRERFRDDLGKVYIRDEFGRAINVKTSKYKAWLDQEYMNKYNAIAYEKHLNDITAKMNRTWNHEIPALPLRIAWEEEQVWLDLGDAFVHVRGDGWQVLDKSEPIFAPSMAKQVRPIPNQDNLDSLRPYVNVKDDDWLPFQAWILGMFIQGGTYPIMVINGGEETGKSFVTRICRKLVDPSFPELSKYPKSLEDIDTQASAQFLLCYDNLSSLPLALSDVFCTIASGTGVIRRSLYTNEDPFVRQWRRPIIINGINETLARRQDFNSRALVFDLPELPKDDRFPEKQAWQEVENKLSGWLGSILNAVVYGIKHPTKTMPKIRLTDFGMWVTSCLPYFGYSETQICEALEKNHRLSKLLLVESDLVTKYLIALIEAHRNLKKVPTTQLFQMTSELVIDEDRRSKEWPDSTVGFGIAVGRASSTIRALGYTFVKIRSKGGGTCWDMEVPK